LIVEIGELVNPESENDRMECWMNELKIAAYDLLCERFSNKCSNKLLRTTDQEPSKRNKEQEKM